MGRGEVKAASVAWATAGEVAAAGVAARAKALREQVSALQASTAWVLRTAAARAGQRRADGDPPSLQPRFQRNRAMVLLHDALDASARLTERHADVVEQLAGLAPRMAKVLAWVTDRAAERAQQAERAERERALQEKIQAGMAGMRQRLAEHQRQQAEAARDGRARGVVETWEGLIRAHHAALPGINTDPTLGGTREKLLRFAQALLFRPELVHALATRPAEFGMEQRPNLARVLADPSPERALTALLDGVEAKQRATLKAEAERKAELEAKQRPAPRPGPSPSPW